MRQMRTELRDETRNIRVVVGQVETKVDRLETKVDELAGLFKCHITIPRDGTPGKTDEP